MKPISLLLNNQHLQDLNPLIAGQQVCENGYSYGPHIRKYTLMHYVLSGKGTLYARGGEHSVHAGQVFLILPGEVTTYTADTQDPWHYRWLGFDGSLTHRFSKLPPVFDLPEVLFPSLPFDQTHCAPEYQLTAQLFMLYAHLFPAHTDTNEHVQKVKGIIQAAYMQDLRVEGLAQELSLDRRYLTRLFKEKTGLSIQQYLINVRMEEADQYLRQGYSVQQTASLCGYNDVSNFSRMYKRHYGQSPAFRKKNADF